METVGCGRNARQGSGVRGAVWAQRPVLSPQTQRPMDRERQQLLLSGQNQLDVKFVNFLFHSLPCGHVIEKYYSRTAAFWIIFGALGAASQERYWPSFCFPFPFPVLRTSTALACSPPSPRHQK